MDPLWTTGGTLEILEVDFYNQVHDRLSHTNIKEGVHDRLSHTNIKDFYNQVGGTMRGL